MARFYVTCGVGGWLVCRTAGLLKGRLVNQETVDRFATEEAACARCHYLNATR